MVCVPESNSLPPQLPPRHFLADAKESETKTSEQATKALSDTYLMRLQHIDLSAYGEKNKNSQLHVADL